MGQVWAAFHHALRRDVAVKFLSGPLASDPSALHRFTLEAQTIGRLQCPYVPQIFDFGTMPDGAPFIVMELLDGVDLQTRLEHEGCLSLAQTECLVAQMCTVLSLAHGLGLIHRDIKPSNIVLVRGEGDAFTAKLLDFGIVKALSVVSATRTGTTLGTPSYMSPEQLTGAKEIDTRTDLWSLAVVAYCCLTRELPFAGETFGAVCLSIHGGPFVAPSLHRSGLPASLDEWFRKALNRLPEERFQSAAEMSAALLATLPTVGSTIPPALGPSGPGPESLGPSLVTLVAPTGANPRWRTGLVAAASLIVLGSLAFAARSTFEPAAASDWSSAERMGRALAGALGKRATLFANGGPTEVADAGAPSPAFPQPPPPPDAPSPSPSPSPDVALPVAPPLAPDAKSASPRSAAPAGARHRSSNPGPAWVVPFPAPRGSVAPLIAPPPSMENPYGP
jgi:serine/threonine-protein kinase